jgi:uncharacterized protein (DUF1778 family)
MPTPSEIENITIELTISEVEKHKLDKAAATIGLSLNEYLLNSALKAATEELVVPQQIVLSQSDWEILTFALENPPEPKQELKTAVANYQQKYGGNRL